MDKGLQANLDTVEGLIKIQRDFVISGKPEAEYMHGMLNGLIMAHSVFARVNPKFHSMVRRGTTKIRHKSKK